MKTFLVVLLTVLALLIVLLCVLKEQDRYTECGVRNNDWKRHEEYSDRWRESTSLADIRRELNQMQLHECAKEYQQSLDYEMDLTILYLSDRISHVESMYKKSTMQARLQTIKQRALVK